MNVAKINQVLAIINLLYQFQERARLHGPPFPGGFDRENFYAVDVRVHVIENRLLWAMLDGGVESFELALFGG